MDIIALFDGLLWDIPIWRNLLTQAGGLNISPSDGDLKTLGLAPEGDQFLNAGLSAEVVETILNFRGNFMLLMESIDCWSFTIYTKGVKDGASLGRYHFEIRFLCGTLKMRSLLGPDSGFRRIIIGTLQADGHSF